MKPRFIHRALLAVFLLAYLAISLSHLDSVPRVYADEPWQASTGWKLAQEGTFGSDLFAGWHGMERRYYGYMPLHPLLLAASFEIGGVGLFQARLETVLLGLLVLLLTYYLGRRLLDPTVALVALAVLLTWRLSLTTPYLVSGIPLIDLARIARYDMLVAVMGLLALLAYRWADSRFLQAALAWPFTIAGLLAGLAALSHVYGAFWIVALGLVALLERRGWRPLLALALGFAVPCLCYLGYVLGGLEEWSGQVREYGPRFQLFDPRWYLGNLLREHHRYAQGLGPLGWDWLARPGFWLGLLAIPAALISYIRRAWKGADGEEVAGRRTARLLVVPTLTFAGLFALLIWLKLFNYVIVFLPLVALMLAGWIVGLWRHGHRRRRLVLSVAALALVLEGGGQLIGLHRAAGSTTPWSKVAEDLRHRLPHQGTTLLLHHYWFGLHDRDVRSWVVPVVRSHPHYFRPPVSFTEALDEVGPAAVVIDHRMRSMMARDLDRRQQLAGWLQQHDFGLEAELSDPVYGHFEICTRGSTTTGRAPCPLPAPARMEGAS